MSFSVGATQLVEEDLFSMNNEADESDLFSRVKDLFLSLKGKMSNKIIIENF